MAAEFANPGIIGVVGWKGSGKTTVVEGIVEFLKSKGFVVGTVKHAMEISLNEPATDSWRHKKAGASRCVVMAKDSTVLIDSQIHDFDLIVSRYLWMCDFVVVEGFKHLAIPKIVVASQEGTPEGLSNVVALVGGVSDPQIPSFAIGEIDLLCQYLFDKGVIRPAHLGVKLVIDNQVIPMNEFVKRSFAGVVTGFIRALKSINNPKCVEVYLRLSDDEGQTREG